MINQYARVATNIQSIIREKRVKLLEGIVDLFSEYSDYLTDTNDTIKNAFDKLKDIIGDRIHK